MTKRCNRCEAVKSTSEFYGDRTAKDGLQGKCKTCSKAHAADWFRTHPPDPERRRETLRRFRARNPERDAEYGRKWREKDPARALELARARGEKWRQNKPERKVASQMRRRARLRTVTPTDEEYIAILRGDPCSYCGSRGKAVDHIEPLFHGGDAGWENQTAACRSCNSSKRIDSLLLFLLRAA